MSDNEKGLGFSSDDSFETEISEKSIKGHLKRIVGCYSESSDSQDEQWIESNQNIPVTPFNMKEELEEGYFDKYGTYHLTEKSASTDVWLESINWSNNRNYSLCNYSSRDSSDSESDETLIEIYEKIVAYLKPKETVAKAICRLGKNTLSAAQRWKLKKLGKNLSCNYKRKSKTVSDLTGLANYILNKTGNTDIYQETYEKLVEKISNFKILNKDVNNPQSLSVETNRSEVDNFNDCFAKEEQIALQFETVT